MITYVNNSNAEQYRVLYAKATRDLMNHDTSGEVIAPGGDAAIGRDRITSILGSDFSTNNGEDSKPVYEPYTFYVWDSENEEYVLASEEEPKSAVTYYQAPDITSLNEYFSYIEYLANIDKLYTVLPLDEDTFDINANTREIKVPAHFQKNGISVQGDEIAEVIYFKINRYFDTIDLATKDIYIQWRSAATDDATGELMEGISVPWCIDLESSPNYIIFGWPISSKITAAAGEISFAIRFYEFKNDQMVYSFSSLTQKVAVKPSLDFDILKKYLADKGLGEASALVLDDNTQLILSRLENSLVTEGDAAAVPVFIKNLNPDNSPVVIDSHQNETVEAWLALDGGGFRVVPIDALVQATSEDGGRISYSWNKFDIDTNAGPLAVTGFKNIFQRTEDTSRQENKTYYQKISNSNEDSAYRIYDGDAFDSEDEEYPEYGIFERFSRISVDGVGKYQVTVTNRAGNSTARTESYMLLVKRPVEPVFETNLPSREWLEPNTTDADNSYKTTLSVVVSSSDQDKSKFTYQWEKKNLGNGTDWEVIDGATESSYTIPGSAERIENSEIGKVGDGYYHVIVTNHLNGEVETEVSDPVRVTHLPSVPIVSSVGRTSFNLEEARSLGLQVNATIDPNAGEDTDIATGDQITYQWYKYRTAPDHTTEADIQAAIDGTYELSMDKEIEGATNSQYYPTEDGNYFCMVTNTYNDKHASKISVFFIVSNASIED